MSDDKEKKVRGYLYGEIDRLKMYISEMYDDHYVELKTWTWKCGRMGNEIGSLRKQLAEKNNLQYDHDRLQLKLSVKNAELRKVNADLEQAQCEILKLKQSLEKKEREDQLMIDEIKNECEALRMQIQQNEHETEHPVVVTKVENDLQLEDRSISTELMNLVSDVADITIENEIEFNDCGQINELEVDNIVKTYCSSGSEVDGDKKVSEPSDTIELAQDDPENLPGNITEQDDSVENITEQEDSFGNMKEQRDDDTKQKAKYQFWYTLKKRVSIKGKQTKPTPLTS